MTERLLHFLQMTTNDNATANVSEGDMSHASQLSRFPHFISRMAWNINFWTCLFTSQFEALSVSATHFSAHIMSCDIAMTWNVLFSFQFNVWKIQHNWSNWCQWCFLELSFNAKLAATDCHEECAFPTCSKTDAIKLCAPFQLQVEQLTTRHKKIWSFSLGRCTQCQWICCGQMLLWCHEIQQRLVKIMIPLWTAHAQICHAPSSQIDEFCHVVGLVWQGQMELDLCWDFMTKQVNSAWGRKQNSCGTRLSNVGWQFSKNALAMWIDPATGLRAEWQTDLTTKRTTKIWKRYHLIWGSNPRPRS